MYMYLVKHMRAVVQLPNTRVLSAQLLLQYYYYPPVPQAVAITQATTLVQITACSVVWPATFSLIREEVKIHSITYM